jgi:hypothetical protein
MQRKLFSKASIWAAIVLGSVVTATPAAYGQEVEPNDPCASAQDLGPVTLPFSQDGSQDSVYDGQTGELVDPDVDFFELTGTPGSTVKVDLEGQATGAGTLGDPVLGFFDSTCTPQQVNDDGGVGSRIPSF